MTVSSPTSTLCVIMSFSMETERMNAPPVASLHRRSEKMPRKRWTKMK